MVDKEIEKTAVAYGEGAGEDCPFSSRVHGLADQAGYLQYEDGSWGAQNFSEGAVIDFFLL